jgi:phage gp36-like protein
MSWLRRAFTLPVHESKIVLVLMLCVVSMSLMSVALVWQAQIIASQREAIQWLQSFKFGG